MATAPTLALIEGTTLAFSTEWATDDEARTPIDMTGCTARFVIVPEDSRRALVECTTQNGGIEIDVATGTISIRVAPEQTAEQLSDAWKNARYELRITFPSGDVYSLLRGKATLTPGVANE
jgi:hypothetical protein|tara:strand:- start:929 stop:1291 length:363 start_codon:yes stop_codon:yes gene_type:complete